MTTVYKLTTLTRVTRVDTLWGEGITHTLPIRKKYGLGSRDVLHAYVSPELAVLLNPIHAAFLDDALLWECDGDVVINDGTRIGCISITTHRIISKPAITLEQRVKFAIRCAMSVCKDPLWNTWAHNWLSNSDRSSNADAADATTYVAAYKAAYADPADAAAAAAYAAAAAAYVAAADAAAAAPYKAAYAAAAAVAATYAADAATYAARVAKKGKMNTDFIARIARECVCDTVS